MRFLFLDTEKKRLDSFLFNEISKIHGNISRSFVQKLIKNSGITINSALIDEKNYLLKEGDVVVLDYEKFDNFRKNSYNENSSENVKPFEMELKILYEDEDLLVIDKPEDLACHSGKSNIEKNLVNVLISKYQKSQNLSNLAGDYRPGIVHRLDKDTTGLMLVAKNNESHMNLAEQIQNKTCIRKYRALCFYESYQDKGVISEYMRKSLKYYEKMEICNENDIGAKYSSTEFKVVEFIDIRKNKFAIVEFNLKTGRTHQIRLHALHSGFPIVGDTIYLNPSNYTQKHINSLFNHQILDSFSIEFVHPKTGKIIKIERDNNEIFKNRLKNIEDFFDKKWL